MVNISGRVQDAVRITSANDYHHCLNSILSNLLSLLFSNYLKKMVQKMGLDSIINDTKAIGFPLNDGCCEFLCKYGGHGLSYDGGVGAFLRQSDNGGVGVIFIGSKVIGLE